MKIGFILRICSRWQSRFYENGVFPVCPFPFRPLPSRPLTISSFTILPLCYLAHSSFCPLTILPFCHFTLCRFAQCYLASFIISSIHHFAQCHFAHLLSRRFIISSLCFSFYWNCWLQHTIFWYWSPNSYLVPGKDLKNPCLLFSWKN